IAWSFNPRGIDIPLHCGILLDTIRYTCRDLGFANPSISAHQLRVDTKKIEPEKFLRSEKRKEAENPKND
ncbi:hypothetical protein PIB30_083052, partial [Stylosanthes scabra]|nr:hypothetical protein [Stylosanthes scabra]